MSEMFFFVPDTSNSDQAATDCLFSLCPDTQSTFWHQDGVEFCAAAKPLSGDLSSSCDNVPLPEVFVPETATNITGTKEEFCGPTEAEGYHVKNNDKKDGGDKRHRDRTTVDKYYISIDDIPVMTVTSESISFNTL